ncbi:gamma-glutamyltransferase [Aquirhabdus parva]|uniref:Glutathione hydrolase proenzyme n=1 Tax=Aquirhabdus parva TaxID=2283318 RepID=A0A345P6D8_9GAMM|nr:gamma-glutamyltransferase [Aquirhabdus parva]AXI02847.1 gamma-glutamyltransferase [Aquirhabdus parva]
MKKLLFVLPLFFVYHTSQAYSNDAPPPEASSGLKPAQSITTTQGVCVTAHPLATQACQTVLNQGGSAADGAMAAAWMLGLVEPQSSGLGGGGYLVYFDGHKTIALDGRETAPKSAKENRFLDSNGAPLPFRQAVTNGLSVGTPGMVRLMQQISKQYGQVKWQTTLKPAILAAQNGFHVTPRLHLLLSVDPSLRQSNAASIFYPEGQPLAVGTLYKNPAYAQTLQTISKKGPEYFYKGTLRTAILAAANTQGSDLTPQDFDQYKVVTSNAICKVITTYQVCSAPPSSSGGITVLQILSLLQGELPKDPISAVTYLTNASRLAFADRDEYIADPAFEKVPVTQLLDSSYLQKRSALATGEHLNQVTAGLGSRQPSLEGVDAPNTSHISVVDSKGRAASMTMSIESAFGSNIWVKEGGFFLNNELTDFSFAPTNKGIPVANRVQGGKRPRSSMAPTLLLNAQGTQVQGVLGSPGGSQIIGYVAQATLDLLGGKTVQQTLDTPHILRRGDSTELEQGRFDDAFKQSLVKAGHLIKEGDMTSGLAIIWRTNEGWVAGADPRREGIALAQKDSVKAH